MLLKHCFLTLFVSFGDLFKQEIRCYVCNCVGHLCCITYVGSCPKEVSCYRCGKMGHTGLVSAV